MKQSHRTLVKKSDVYLPMLLFFCISVFILNHHVMQGSVHKDIITIDSSEVKYYSESISKKSNGQYGISSENIISTSELKTGYLQIVKR